MLRDRVCRSFVDQSYSWVVTVGRSPLGCSDRISDCTFTFGVKLPYQSSETCKDNNLSFRIRGTHFLLVMTPGSTYPDPGHHLVSLGGVLRGQKRDWGLVTGRLRLRLCHPDPILDFKT